MMKKLLVGTTSLAAVTMIASPAMASERIQLQLGGKLEQYFAGFKALDKGGRKASDGFGVDSDTEVYFDGSTTLDNGIIVRAHIELEAEAHSDGDRNADEQFIDVTGNFGRIRIGEKTGVFDSFAVRAPNGGYVSQQDLIDWIRPGRSRGNGSGNNYVDLEPTLDDDSARISYFTPQYYGFSAGISYAPNSGIYDFGSVRVREGKDNSNEIQFSLGYDNTFANGLRMRADAGFATTIGAETLAYRAGLGLTYDNWTISGGYLGTKAESDMIGRAQQGSGVNKGGFEAQIWEAGIAWEVKPGGVEFVYAQSHADNRLRNATGITGAGSAMGDSMAFKLGGWYNLGPGIRAVANAFYAETDGHGNSELGDDRSALGLVTGLVLNF